MITQVRCDLKYKNVTEEYAFKQDQRDYGATS